MKSDIIILVLALIILSFGVGLHTQKLLIESYPPQVTHDVAKYTFQNDGAEGVHLRRTFKVPENSEDLNKASFDMKNGLWQMLEVVGADLNCVQDASVSLRSKDGKIIQNPTFITFFFEDNIPGSTAVLIIRFRIRDDVTDKTAQEVIDYINELSSKPFSLRFKNFPPS